MDKKTLKISENPIVSSECFSYFKMGIIQTIPNYEEWLGDRFKLFIDSDGDARFGEHGVIYTLSSFSDILKIEDGRIFEVDKERLIPFIMESIDAGKYVMLDLNFAKISEKCERDFQLHETLVYGYDLAAEELIVTELVNFSFREARIPFDKARDAYEDVRRFFYNDTLELLNRKRFFTGLTLLSPRYDYDNINADYDLFIRLEWELAGIVYEKVESNAHCESHVTTGIACVKKLYTDLQTLVENGNYDYDLLTRYRTWALKISERENVILHALAYFFSKYGIDGGECLNQLKECYEMMYQNVLMFYKYGYSRNPAIIGRIAAYAEEVYHKELRFFEEVTALFKKNYDAVFGIKRS